MAAPIILVHKPPPTENLYSILEEKYVVGKGVGHKRRMRVYNLRSPRTTMTVYVHGVEVAKIAEMRLGILEEIGPRECLYTGYSGRLTFAGSCRATLSSFPDSSVVTSGATIDYTPRFDIKATETDDRGRSYELNILDVDIIMEGGGVTLDKAPDREESLSFIPAKVLSLKTLRLPQKETK